MTPITEAPFTRCDSCGLHYDDSGTVTFEQPSRASINSEAGICPGCVAELTRLGVPLVDERLKEILSGGDTRIEARTPTRYTVRTEAGPSAAQFISKPIQTLIAADGELIASGLGRDSVGGVQNPSHEHETKDG